MAMTYPCSFEEAAQKPLEEMLAELSVGSLRKVRTLSDAINGKIKLVEGFLPDQPKSFVVKQFPKAAAQAAMSNECPRNEIFASLAISKVMRIPNVVDVLFAAKDEKSYYLALEHCPHGELLAVILKSGRLVGDTLQREVIHSILTATQGLHKEGVAHRDLSLENWLVAADGSLRLIDFAQAVMVHAPGDATNEARVPQKYGPPGKPHYRCPELASGAPYLATKADTFAIGVMLYALVMGSYPFLPNASSDDPSRVELFPPEEAELGRCTRLHLQLQKANKNIAEGISPACLDMMEKLLAPNPDLRLSVEEALKHPWMTGADAAEANNEDASTDCTGDTDMMTNDGDSVGVHVD